MRAERPGAQMVRSFGRVSTLHAPRSGRLGSPCGEAWPCTFAGQPAARSKVHVCFGEVNRISAGGQAAANPLGAITSTRTQSQHAAANAMLEGPRCAIIVQPAAGQHPYTIHHCPSSHFLFRDARIVSAS
jgi:hypothetical protein